VPRRDPQRARVLGLWTAGWLAVFLVVGMLWLGEPSVQWPVLAVPLLWALLALRPRRGSAADDHLYDEEPDHWDDDGWDDGAAPRSWEVPPGPRPAERTDTVERPALRRPSGYDEWDGRRG
jgi:hypothetical protein